MAAKRRFKVEPPLQSMLELSLENLLPDEIQVWKDEVRAGEFSEAAHAVFVALGWINARDVRVTEVRQPKAEPTASRRSKIVDPETLLPQADISGDA